ncbi:MAG: TerB family tellurite resistance protein [Alphaproteobacteria bacterium]
MSIWGKVLGGAAGFALGGPLGALIGALAGHAVDRMRATRRVSDVEARRIAFTIGVIVLAAKMAKADGVVTRDEINAFKRVFHVPTHELNSVGRVFNEARKEASGFESYAEQIAGMFHHNPVVLEELLNGLFHIAAADRVIHSAELTYLRRVAEIFGFDDVAFERVRARYAGVEKADPYRLLGVRSAVSDRELKAAYRRLVRENHPDVLTAQGMPKEFVQLANERLAKINDAYDRIVKQRGLR